MKPYKIDTDVSREDREGGPRAAHWRTEELLDHVVDAVS